MKHAPKLCLMVLVAAGVACNEPVVFEPPSNNQDLPNNDAPNNDVDPDAGDSDPQDADDTPPQDTGNNNPGDAGMEVIEPDPEVFRDTVMPILRAGCNGPICHVRDDFSARRYQVDLGNNLSDEQLAQNLQDTIAWVNFDNPTASELVTQPLVDPGCCATHPGPYLNAQGDDYRLLIEWIEDSVKFVGPPGEDVGPDPDAGDDPDPPESDGVPCDALPDPEAVPGPYRFDRFEQYVNPMLVQRCTRANGCHAVPGNGGGLYLLRDLEDDCAVRWNFLTVRWFTAPERANVLSSPMLEQPLGQQNANQLHGGAVVFQGQSDCGYVLLKLWLEGDLITPPQPPLCDEF